MKIFKKNPNILLELETGWEILQFFTDFESGLLLVITNLIDQSQWEELGNGARSMITKQYIIDPKTQEILPPEIWKGYFSYEPVEIFSENGLYKLVCQRIHEAQKNTDFWQEEIIEIASGKLISSSKSVAFHEKKQENLLERRKKQAEQEKEWAKKQESEPKQFCGHCEKEVAYNALYPKYLCSECCAKLTDSEGRAVVFSNTGFMGTGCQGYYRNSESQKLYNSNICYIEKEKFVADEAKFGGIVIQPQRFYEE